MRHKSSVFAMVTVGGLVLSACSPKEKPTDTKSAVVEKAKSTKKLDNEPKSSSKSSNKGQVTNSPIITPQLTTDLSGLVAPRLDPVVINTVGQESLTVPLVVDFEPDAVQDNFFSQETKVVESAPSDKKLEEVSEPVSDRPIEPIPIEEAIDGPVDDFYLSDGEAGSSQTMVIETPIAPYGAVELVETPVNYVVPEETLEPVTVEPVEVVEQVTVEVPRKVPIYETVVREEEVVVEPEHIELVEVIVPGPDGKETKTIEQLVPAVVETVKVEEEVKVGEETIIETVVVDEVVTKPGVELDWLVEEERRLKEMTELIVSVEQELATVDQKAKDLVESVVLEMEETVPEVTVSETVPDTTVEESVPDVVTETPTEVVDRQAADEVTSEEIVSEEVVEDISNEVVSEEIVDDSSEGVASEEIVKDDSGEAADDSSEEVVDEPTVKEPADEEPADAPSEETNEQSDAVVDRQAADEVVPDDVTPEEVVEEVSEELSNDEVSEELTSDEATSEEVAEVSSEELSSEEVLEDLTSEEVVEEPTSEESIEVPEEPTSEEVSEQSDEIVDRQSSDEVAFEELSEEGLSEELSNDIVSEELTPEEVSEEVVEESSEEVVDEPSEEVIDESSEEVIEVSEEPTSEETEEPSTEIVDRQAPDEVILEDTTSEETVDDVSEEQSDDVSEDVTSEGISDEPTSEETVSEDMTSEDVVEEPTIDEPTSEETVESIVDEATSEEIISEEVVEWISDDVDVSSEDPISEENINKPKHSPYLFGTGYQPGFWYHGYYVEEAPKVLYDLLELRQLDEPIRYERSQDGSHMVSFIGSNSEGLWLIGAALSDEIVAGINSGELLDHNLLASYLVDLVNDERRRLGKEPLAIDRDAEFVAHVRASELAEHGSIRFNNIPHSRPDLSDWRTVYSEYGLKEPWASGENTLSNHFNGNPYQAISEKHIAEKFYNQWKNSKGHYDNMVSDYFDSVGIGVGVSTNDAATTFPTNNFIGVMILTGSQPERQLTHVVEIEDE